jgi:lipopolysaccharide export system protein LptA
MKKIHLIVLLMWTGNGWLYAQTNINTAINPTRAQTLICSDHFDSYFAGRQWVYRGNVRVDDPQMKMTCEQLTVDLPQSGGHINHMVALTNVVIDSVDEKGQTNHATSDKAIYDYKVEGMVTNETVTLSGNAKVENAQGWLTGEPIFWNRMDNSLHADKEHMIIRQNSTTATTTTKSPAAKTNFPPGTIQNIDRMIIPSTQP